ncbi:MAG: hypothetical protein AB7L13_00385 [Acidimicrobiia bacterium]
MEATRPNRRARRATIRKIAAGLALTVGGNVAAATVAAAAPLPTKTTVVAKTVTGPYGDLPSTQGVRWQ